MVGKQLDSGIEVGEIYIDGKLVPEKNGHKMLKGQGDLSYGRLK